MAKKENILFLDKTHKLMKSNGQNIYEDDN